MPGNELEAGNIKQLVLKTSKSSLQNVFTPIYPKKFEANVLRNFAFAFLVIIETSYCISINNIYFFTSKMATNSHQIKFVPKQHIFSISLMINQKESEDKKPGQQTHNWVSH